MYDHVRKKTSINYGLKIDFEILAPKVKTADYYKFRFSTEYGKMGIVVGSDF